MTQIQFNRHRFAARKDLLHFVAEHEGERIYEAIGKNPRAWIDELGIINFMLTKDHPFGGATGVNFAPVGEEGTKQLGDGVLLYRGKNTRQRGLWIKLDKPMYENDLLNFTHYRLATNVTVAVNEQFKGINPESLLPENFEPLSSEPTRVKGGSKRPVKVFDLEGIKVYAKGADTSLSFYYTGQEPGYRLTRIADVARTTSQKELEITKDFTRLGIKVPQIIGIHESSIEPFLFLREVAGKSPDNYITTHREAIIDQDANMLALLCLSGYRKPGFCDFDDKIFNGSDLYLIDVEECRDLYWVAAVNFREVLLNPGGSALAEFRQTQKNMFEHSMRDAIYGYRESLTPDRQSQERYVNTFFGKLGWESPSLERMNDLLDFSKDYMTLDSYLSMMS